MDHITCVFHTFLLYQHVFGHCFLSVCLDIFLPSKRVSFIVVVIPCYCYTRPCVKSSEIFKMHDGFTWEDGLVSLGRQSVQEKEKFDSKPRIDGTR